MSNPFYDVESEKSLKGGRIVVIGRVVSIVSLVVSLAVLLSNDAKADNGFVYTYKYFDSYKYTFYVGILGIVYTGVLQLPLALCYMLRNKHLINSKGFLNFILFTDKIVALLLATAAGAAFGSTRELDSKVDWREISKSKMQDFFAVSYIPASFTLVASIASAVVSLPPPINHQ